MVMESLGGSGKVAVLVTAETKQALKQLRDVSKQTQATAKTSQGLSKSMGAGVKKFGIIAVAALTVVTGGFYAMLRASSYAEVYTKRWQSEQTLIANEWVRRHMGVFDRITDMYVGIRKKTIDKNLTAALNPILLLTGAFGRYNIIEETRESAKQYVLQITKGLTKFKFLMDKQVAEGNKRLIDYSTLWINTYVRPILDFIKSIFNKVTEIVALIPGLGINVEYNVFNGGGGGGGGGDGGDGDDGGDDGHNPPPLAPSSIRSLGMI